MLLPFGRSMLTSFWAGFCYGIRAYYGWAPSTINIHQMVERLGWVTYVVDCDARMISIRRHLHDWFERIKNNNPKEVYGNPHCSVAGTLIVHTLYFRQ